MKDVKHGGQRNLPVRKGRVQSSRGRSVTAKPANKVSNLRHGRAAAESNWDFENKSRVGEMGRGERSVMVLLVSSGAFGLSTCQQY